MVLNVRIRQFYNSSPFFSDNKAFFTPALKKEVQWNIEGRTDFPKGTDSGIDPLPFNLGNQTGAQTCPLRQFLKGKPFFLPNLPNFSTVEQIIPSF